jgi:hypothetical protein
MEPSEAGLRPKSGPAYSFLKQNESNRKSENYHRRNGK